MPDTKPQLGRREVAIALLAIALLLLLAYYRTGGPGKATTPTPLPKTVVENYSLAAGGSELGISRSYQLLHGSFTDNSTVTNKGNSSLNFSSYYVLQNNFGATPHSTQFVAANSFNARFLSQSPLVHASDAYLPPGASASSSFSASAASPSTSPDSSFPPFFFTSSPASTSNEEQALLPVMLAVADYGLATKEAASLGRIFSELLSSPLPAEERLSAAAEIASAFGELRFLAGDSDVAGQQLSSLLSETSPLESRLEAASLYRPILKRAANLADAKHASYSSILTLLAPALFDHSLSLEGRFSQANEKLLGLEKSAGVEPAGALLKESGQAKNPFASALPSPGASGSPSSTPTPDDPYKFFPSQPSQLVLEASELSPTASVESTWASAVNVGYPLARFDGPVQPYASFSVISPGRDLRVRTSIDLNRVVLDNNFQIPFDELRGTLASRFLSLPEKTGNIEILVKVNHADLNSLVQQYGLEYDEDAPTLGQFLADLERASSCNPLGAAAFEAPLPFTQSSTGALTCPLDGFTRISSGYDMHRLQPVLKIVRPHWGIDIPAPKGTPLKAVADGVVTGLPGGGCGLGLRFDNGVFNGQHLETKFCHTSQRFVKVGDVVKAGQVVALVGSTGGISTGNHLHYEIYLGGSHVNPAPYFAGCSRSGVQPVAPQLQAQATALPQGGYTDACLDNSFFGLPQGVDISKTPLESTDLRGPPSISPSTIQNILAKAGSPAAGEAGFANCLYSNGVKYGVDPVFPLAFFQHESSFGKAGVATHTDSIGNMRPLPGFSKYCTSSGCYSSFPSWCASTDAWYKLITQGSYYFKAGRFTVEQIIPVYAPASDGNYPAGYVAFVKAQVAKWRSMEQAQKTP